MAKADKHSSLCPCPDCGSSYFGWIVLLLGLYFLAEHYGYIQIGLPFWPTLLVVAGLWIVLGNKKRV